MPATYLSSKREREREKQRMSAVKTKGKCAASCWHLVFIGPL